MQYEHIDDFLEGKTMDDEVAKAIEDRYLRTEHKRQVPASLFDDWWK
jgi:NAD+ synthase